MAAPISALCRHLRSRLPTGFYGGAFLGRLLLAEPPFRLGERRMIFLYAVLCVGLQLVFWLVPNIIVEAVAICILGSFSGPFFAAGISVASKIFPADVRSSAIAFVFVFGQMFPVLTGILSARTGVKVLQPMLVALLCATAISWLCFQDRLSRATEEVLGVPSFKGRVEGV
ncbi:hypothetical protein BO82DRAFT_295151 [Aspergillus uvarum CBS 121591]|uniref:MFS general substrate transporter n=1 Tax=Aspergillus uvarum CBS 121591 TaxID=1448315 RepID=A0A319BW19_9EURO|nr:hypothetical protein BO82DRAFT_295151 [Aspergillus uvarum CBS 121591]PYH76864.1 hypothetical protein BO82DRAFT_295151 [Aspergillus uvarum CBS 121591]